MKPRTVVGFGAAFVVVVVASYLSVANQELLTTDFALGGGAHVPLFVVLLVVFAAGFLPPAIRLLLDGVRRDLEERRSRRDSRRSESLDNAFRRAMDLVADGQLARATEELEMVLAERPDHFAAQLLLGNCLRLQGRLDEAIAAHQKASESHPHSVAVLYELVADYEAKGEKAVAREIRNRILRDFPNRGLAVLRHRRDAAVKSGDWTDAVQLQEEIDARVDAGGEGWPRAAEVRKGLTYRRGVDLLEEERFDDAAEVFEDLIRQEPRFVPARIMLGEAHLLAGREGQAMTQWRKGYAETGSPVFLQRLEDHLIEQELPEQAIETLRSISNETKTDILPRFFLGRLYYRLEMHDEAFKVLAPLEERLEGSPTFHYLLGRIHERRGELARAAARYLACVRLLGVHSAEFVCQSCGERFEEWHDRCSACGSWGAIEMCFDQEQISEEELGIVRLPVWRSEGE